MAELSQPLQETARKSLAAILQGLSSVGQVNVAKALDASESTISKLKSDGDLDRLAKLLAIVGLKVVPVRFRCEDPDYLAAMEMLAHRYMESRQAGAKPALNFEDPE